jgi:hypothetical protein
MAFLGFSPDPMIEFGKIDPLRMSLLSSEPGLKIKEL